MDLIVIDSEGVEYEVDVERGRDGFEVTVGDRSFLVDHVSAGHSHRSLLIGGRQLEVAVQCEKGDSYVISTARGEDRLLVRDPLDHLLQTTGAGGGVVGPTRVSALMPGRVVALLAAEGDRVEEGQGILVLEAMKMENEIQTEMSGVVKSIFVDADQSVDSGDALFEIEPDSAVDSD